MTLARRLVALARPAGMPLVLALPAAGYGLAHWEWGAPAQRPAAFAAVLAAWWWLSAGALWLNAALDEGDGEVLMGPRPELVPHLRAWAGAALLAAVTLSLLAGTAPAACCAVCAALALAYSHPRTAWKGDPVLGPAVNLVGYGVASPLAGWLVPGLPPTARTAPALALLAIWVVATYFGAQAFQRDEDAARGYRTFVVTAGPVATVHVARAGYAAASLGLFALAVVGWFPRAVLVGVPAWIWLDRHLARWARGPIDADGARTMLRRATVLAAVVLGGALGAYADSVVARRPPAGLDTAVRFAQ